MEFNTAKRSKDPGFATPRARISGLRSGVRGWAADRTRAIEYRGQREVCEGEGGANALCRGKPQSRRPLEGSPVVQVQLSTQCAIGFEIGI